MKWASPDDWADLDMSGHCRVWTQNKDGTQKRMTNRAKVWHVESTALNHLEGRTPRMLFCQAWDDAAAVSATSDPLLTAQWIDNKVNARERTYRILSLPEVSETPTASDAEVWTNAASSTNVALPEQATAHYYPQDLIYRTFSTARGGASNALYTEAISVSEGAVLCDVCCQESYVNTFDSTLDHDFIYPYSASPGAKIVTGLSEQFRSLFHRLRMNQNRLAFCFLGTAVSGVYGALLDAASALGFMTTSETYVNILDQTVTSRTASTPGMSMSGYGAGVGLSGSCGIEVYVLAATNDVDGLVKVIGPDHVADNNVEISITSSTPTWYSSGPVYLNTLSTDTDTTTARNKFDVHFLAGSLGETYLYSILGFTLQT